MYMLGVEDCKGIKKIRPAVSVRTVQAYLGRKVFRKPMDPFYLTIQSIGRQN